MTPEAIFSIISRQTSQEIGGVRGTTRPIYDSQTAAAMCSGIPEKQFKAALLKWAMDESVIPYLRIMLWIRADEIAKKNGWKVKRLKQFHSSSPTLLMAETVLYEVLDPAFLSKERWSGTTRYERVGKRFGVKSKWAWHAGGWQARYEELFSEFSSWADSGKEHGRNRLWME